MSDFKKGDSPPSGYMAWHRWAEVQYKSGLRQERCGMCGLFKFPQELSKNVIEHELGTSPICKVCDQPNSTPQGIMMEITPPSP
jgi:hypothetical protein